MSRSSSVCPLITSFFQHHDRFLFFSTSLIFKQTKYLSHTFPHSSNPTKISCFNPMSAFMPTPAIVFRLPTDEFVQYEGPHAALVRFRGLWIAVGWSCCVHRLLAADGGRHCPAAEPDHWGQDGAALWPLEGLLCGRLVARNAKCVRHGAYFLCMCASCELF